MLRAGRSDDHDQSDPARPSLRRSVSGMRRRRQERVEYDGRNDIGPLRAQIEQQGGRLIDSSWEFQHSHPGWSVRYPEDRSKADAIEQRVQRWEAEGRA